MSGAEFVSVLAAAVEAVQEVRFPVPRTSKRLFVTLLTLSRQRHVGQVCSNVKSTHSHAPPVGNPTTAAIPGPNAASAPDRNATPGGTHPPRPLPTFDAQSSPSGADTALLTRISLNRTSDPARLAAVYAAVRHFVGTLWAATAGLDLGTPSGDGAASLGIQAALVAYAKNTGDASVAVYAQSVWISLVPDATLAARTTTSSASSTRTHENKNVAHNPRSSPTHNDTPAGDEEEDAALMFLNVYEDTSIPATAPTNQPQAPSQTQPQTQTQPPAQAAPFPPPAGHRVHLRIPSTLWTQRGRDPGLWFGRVLWYSAAAVSSTCSPPPSASSSTS